MYVFIAVSQTPQPTLLHMILRVKLLPRAQHLHTYLLLVFDLISKAISSFYKENSKKRTK